MEHQLHCDRCGRPLGTYLYGKGGIEEIAHIGGYPYPNQSIPDMFCKDQDICYEYRIHNPEKF